MNIGNKCDLAPEVIIATGSHEIGKTRRAGKGLTYNTNIGDYTWIGIRSTIIQGSSIGQGCIVGACTMINKNISDNLVVVGVPGKIIKKL